MGSTTHDHIISFTPTEWGCTNPPPERDGPRCLGMETVNRSIWPRRKKSEGLTEGGARRGLSRPHKTHWAQTLPGQPGDPPGMHVAAHLPCVELRIRVWEARELPGTAVEVHVAGAKGGKEAQVVIHWKTQAGIREVALEIFLGFNPATFRSDPISSPQFPPHAPDVAPGHV